MDEDFAFTRSSHSKAVLLFHGLTGAPSELSRYGKALFDAGYDVYCPVLPGHCRGVEALKLTRWQDWYGFALEAFDKLAARYPDVYLSGICFGSVLTLAVAAERPAVTGISALSTTFFLDGWGLPPIRVLMPLGFATIFKFLYAFPESGPMGVKNPSVRKQVAESMKSEHSPMLDCFPLLCVSELSKLSRFVRRRLPLVKTPVIVFHSLRDDLASIKNARVLMSGVGSTRKDLITLRNSYHLITIDNERDTVSSKTIAFFDSLSRKPAIAVQV